MSWQSVMVMIFEVILMVASIQKWSSGMLLCVTWCYGATVMEELNLWAVVQPFYPEEGGWYSSHTTQKLKQQVLLQHGYLSIKLHGIMSQHTVGLVNLTLINGYCFSTYMQLHWYCWCIIVNACGHQLVMPVPLATILLCPYLWPPFCYASTFGHHFVMPVPVTTILLHQYLWPPFCYAHTCGYCLVMPVPLATILLCPGQRHYSSGYSKSRATKIISNCDYFHLHSGILFAKVGDSVMLTLCFCHLLYYWCV